VENKLLSSISLNKEVILVNITGGHAMRKRLADMGLIERVRFKVLQSHPSGPCVLILNKTRLVIGKGMAQKIIVREV